MMTQLKNSPAKGIALGVLSLVLVLLVVRATLGGSPKKADARLAPVGDAKSTTTAIVLTDNAAQELERSAAQSAALWKTLRAQRGISAHAAFRFDSAYYTVDPSKQNRNETSGKQIPNKSEMKTTDALSMPVVPDMPSLTLQSTATGAHPTAVINSQILQIGDVIQGCKVVSIRAREVTVKKDGQTYTLEMGR